MKMILEEVVASHENVLVDFTADWCEPCKWILPILEDVEKHFNKRIKIQKVDIDKNSELAKSLHILSVPTIVLFVKGEEVWRKRGFDVSDVLIRDISKHIK